MTACFKLMKVLQPAHDQKQAFCESCVYFSRNLDESFPLANTTKRPFCGMDFAPGSDMCIEMRTNNCSVKKR